LPLQTEREQKTMDELIYRRHAIDEIKRFSGYVDDDMIQRLEIGLNRLPGFSFVKSEKCWECGITPLYEGGVFCVKCKKQEEIEFV